MPTKRRKDLDALRGIAIFSVVLFHMDTGYFTNGHFGVDVFFVLSGYFIFTSHCLMPDRQLFEFFSKRIWRIFPGYFTFLTLTTVAAFYLLIPGDFVLYVKELLYAAGFMSNFKNRTSKDYWNTLQENYVLLHTWSLSVEIQFYLCSAPIAFLLKKTGKHFAFILILLSAGSHFFVHEVVAFYSLPCRIWQFLCGYVAVNWQHQYLPVDTVDRESDECEKSRYFRIAGWEFRTLNCSGIDNRKTVCVFSILILCLASSYQELLFFQRILITALSSYVVSSNSAEFSLIDLIWNNKYVWFLGIISYSWYLWHWPVAVLISYLIADTKEPFNWKIYIFVPFGLAVLSTFVIERPLQRQDHSKIPTLIMGMLPMIIFVSSSILFLQCANMGWDFGMAAKSFTPERQILPEAHIIHVTNQASTPTFDREDQNNYRPTHLRYCQDVSSSAACHIGNGNSTDHTVIWGDSFSMTALLAHNWHLPGIVNKTKITLFTRGGCPPYFSCRLQNPDCANYNKEVFDRLPSMGAKRVIFSSRYVLTYRWILGEHNNQTAAKLEMLECLMSTMRAIMKMGIKEIMLLHQIPEPYQQIADYLQKSLKFGWDLNKMQINRTGHDIKTAGLHETIINACKMTSGCFVEDPAVVLCNSQICPTWYITANNTIHPLYFDGEHLNYYGMKPFSKLFEYPWRSTK